MAESPRWQPVLEQGHWEGSGPVNRDKGVSSQVGHSEDYKP